MQDKGDVLRKDHMDKWKRIFLFTITAILIYFILMTVVTPKRYKLNEGDIATVDIKAPRDIIDEEATKLKEQEVTAKVEKKFTLKNEIKIEASDNVKGFFDKLINLKSNNIDEKSKIAELKKIDTINLSDSEYKESCKTGGKERERRRNRGGHDQRSDQICITNASGQNHSGRSPRRRGNGYASGIEYRA